MSGPNKYREWILETIDSLRSRKARPDLERICRMVRRRHGSDPDRTRAELEKLIQEQTVLKVSYKGSISYRNAAKVQRKSRKKSELTCGGGGGADAPRERNEHLNNNNGDSAHSFTDQEEAEEEEEGDREPNPDLRTHTTSAGKKPQPASGSGATTSRAVEQEHASAQRGGEGSGGPPPPGSGHGAAAPDGRGAGGATGGGDGEPDGTETGSQTSTWSRSQTQTPAPKPKLRHANNSDLGDKLVASVRSLSERSLRGGAPTSSSSSPSSSRGHMKPLGLKEILGYLSSQERLSEEKLTRGKVKVVMEREVARGRLRRTRCGNITLPLRGSVPEEPAARTPCADRLAKSTLQDKHAGKKVGKGNLLFPTRSRAGSTASS